MKLKYKKICFIGMSGVGKSSIGKIIAKKNNLPFIDTDSLIEKKINISIKEFLTQHSEEKFLQLEESTIMNMTIKNELILATGGSVIYSEKSMQFLKKNFTIIYLNDSIENIKKRIKNFDNRGLITNKETNLTTIYNSRKKLYEKWSDITINYPKYFSYNVILSIIYDQIQ